MSNTTEDHVDDGALNQRVAGDVEHRVTGAYHRHAEDRAAEGGPDHDEGDRRPQGTSPRPKGSASRRRPRSETPERPPTSAPAPNPELRKPRPESPARTRWIDTVTAVWTTRRRQFGSCPIQ